MKILETTSKFTFLSLLVTTLSSCNLLFPYGEPCEAFGVTTWSSSSYRVKSGENIQFDVKPQCPTDTIQDYKFFANAVYIGSSTPTNTKFAWTVIPTEAGKSITISANAYYKDGLFAPLRPTNGMEKLTAYQ